MRSLEQPIRNLEGSDGLALRAQLTRHAAIQRQTRLPEGYGRLDDAALANATIWAPTDAAFAKLGDEPKSLSPDELQAMLGFHITPPRRLITAPQPWRPSYVCRNSTAIGIVVTWLR